VPRIRTVDLMLAGTVVLWALNLTLSKYILTHGLKPLAYSGLRYSAAAVVFVGLSGWRERAVRLSGRQALLAAAAATLLLYTNQLGFVYALRFTTASTVGLIFGATPIFTALIAVAIGMERVGKRFVAAAIVSFGGVALVAIGDSGGLSGSVKGDLLGLWTAITWGAYSVAIASLMSAWSPIRVSAFVLPAVSLLLLVTGIPQLHAQAWGGLGWGVWATLALAALGPLVLTNLLWFTALDRVGPSYATLFANIQPFVAVLFAVVLLSESLTVVQILGGVTIGLGVALVWRRSPAPVPAE
jgi:drug/metabolite transporter (DMT)-like permease